MRPRFKMKQLIWSSTAHCLIPVACSPSLFFWPVLLVLISNTDYETASAAKLHCEIPLFQELKILSHAYAAQILTNSTDCFNKDYVTAPKYKKKKVKKK